MVPTSLTVLSLGLSEGHLRSFIEASKKGFDDHPTVAKFQPSDQGCSPQINDSIYDPQEQDAGSSAKHQHRLKAN